MKSIKQLSQLSPTYKATKGKRGEKVVCIHVFFIGRRGNGN